MQKMLQEAMIYKTLLTFVKPLTATERIT